VMSQATQYGACRKPLFGCLLAVPRRPDQAQKRSRACSSEDNRIRRYECRADPGHDRLSVRCGVESADQRVYLSRQDAQVGFRVLAQDPVGFDAQLLHRR